MKSKLKKKLWRVFSQYIRRRDLKKGCISCGKKCEMTASWHAGHYYTRRANGLEMYFDEINVQGQCAGCNTFLEGNTQDFAKGLIKRYGKDILEKLETKRIATRNKIWQLEDYEKRIAKYKELIRVE